MLPLKKAVISHLEHKRYEDIISLSPSFHKITNTLISLSYDKTGTLSWRAIEAMGLVAKEKAKTDTEAVRNVVGRLLWMIRDESGGIGWSSPEMLGEIVRNSPELFADVGPVITSFHEEKMLTPGVLRAVGRMGKINNETVGYAIPITLKYLKSPDSIIRGNAAYALGELGALGAAAMLKNLLNDAAALDFYEDGELGKKTVAEIAKEALEKIGCG